MKKNHREKQHNNHLIYSRRRHEETVSVAHPSAGLRLRIGALYVDINNKTLGEGPSIAVCTEGSWAQGNSPPPRSELHQRRFIKILPRPFEPLKHRQAAASERVEITI